MSPAGRLPTAAGALRQVLSSSSSTPLATSAATPASTAATSSTATASSRSFSRHAPFVTRPSNARSFATVGYRRESQATRTLRRREFSTSRIVRQATPVDEAKSPNEVEEAFDISKVERVSDEADVIIVGGGPAGLSAAIRVKQLAEEKGEEIRVILLEKGAEIGNHILSGAVIQTNALDELLPNWKELGAPLNQLATEDHMRFLTQNGSFPIPHPPQMHNKGNYIVSLSRVTAWLGEQAEAAGVEIYSGFAAAQAIWNDDKTGIKGVITGEMGLDKQGKPKDAFEPGMEFHAPLTLFAEGAHGSLSTDIISRLKLREAVGAEPQTYGLGVKEVWRVKPEKHQPGLVSHTLGWPLDYKTYGGSWLYHMEDNMVSIGLVVGLDYENPYLSPFREFQKMKHHPYFSHLLEGGECIAYGARTLNEGGYQSIPKLNFPGGALIGCSAGFLNVPKIKGTHNAMKSGMVAAEAYYDAWKQRQESGSENVIDLVDYRKRLDDTYVIKELKEVRNLRPSFHNPLGLYGGMAYSGIDSLLLKGRTPWTLHHVGEDHEQTKKASECQPIDYPKPDGKLSFDILTSVARTGTNHEEDAPVHLLVKDGDFAGHTETNVGQYAGLLGQACPAGVYSYLDKEDAGGKEDALGKKFNINAIACIHCKTCSIKTPGQTVKWSPPEAPGGPSYSIT
ncbi:unnamed protein product [Jaminaea pallidilutea]